jgi:hypothetical protein
MFLQKVIRNKRKSGRATLLLGCPKAKLRTRRIKKKLSAFLIRIHQDLQYPKCTTKFFLPYKITKIYFRREWFERFDDDSERREEEQEEVPSPAAAPAGGSTSSSSTVATASPVESIGELAANASQQFTKV